MRAYSASMTGDQSNEGLGTEGTETPPPSRTISSDKDLLAAITDFYVRNVNVIGGGDILTIAGGKPTTRAGMVAASLAGIVIEGRERAIQRLVVVIPPGGDVAEAEGRVWGSFAQSFKFLAGRP